MKILVFSDSHGEVRRMAQIVGETDASAVIFLGDCLRDIGKVARLHPHVLIYSVAGNCDFMSAVPDERIVELGGFKVFLTHGHKHGVKAGLERLLDYAKKQGVNAAFYGHSHIAHISKKDGITLLNPGSISEPRGVLGPSYAIVKILDDELEIEIVEV